MKYDVTIAHWRSPRDLIFFNFQRLLMATWPTQQLLMWATLASIYVIPVSLNLREGHDYLLVRRRFRRM
jgi:hypothetical protein